MPMVSAADLRDPLFKGEDDAMGEETPEDTWIWSVHFINKIVVLLFHCPHVVKISFKLMAGVLGMHTLK